MASSFTEKTPPAFDRDINRYETWKKKFQIWESITDVPKIKHGGLLAIYLDTATQDHILDVLTIEEIKTEDGVTKILNHLDNIFKFDQLVAGHEAYEELECKLIPAYVSDDSDHCREFQQDHEHKRNNKPDAYGNTTELNPQDNSNDGMRLMCKIDDTEVAEIFEDTDDSYEIDDTEVAEIFEDTDDSSIELLLSDPYFEEFCRSIDNRAFFDAETSDDGMDLMYEIDYGNEDTEAVEIFEDTDDSSLESLNDSRFEGFCRGIDNSAFSDTQTITSPNQSESVVSERETTTSTEVESRALEDEVRNTHGKEELSSKTSEAYILEESISTSSDSSDAQKEFQIISAEFKSKGSQLCEQFTSGQEQDTNKSPLLSLLKHKSETIEKNTPVCGGVKETKAGSNIRVSCNKHSHAVTNYVYCNPHKKRRGLTTGLGGHGSSAPYGLVMHKEIFPWSSIGEEPAAEDEHQWKRRKKKNRISVRHDSGTKKVRKKKPQKGVGYRILRSKEKWKKRRKKTTRVRHYGSSTKKARKKKPKKRRRVGDRISRRKETWKKRRKKRNRARVRHYDSSIKKVRKKKQKKRRRVRVRIFLKRETKKEKNK